MSSDDVDIDEIRKVANACRGEADGDYLLEDAADGLNSAADEVERLREENADLRKALRDIAEERDNIRLYVDGDWQPKDEVMKARAEDALEDTDE